MTRADEKILSSNGYYNDVAEYDECRGDVIELSLPGVLDRVNDLWDNVLVL